MLDGGLASELERAGHDLNDPLWSAKVLLEDPDAVLAVHRAFLEAGADCISTATYQATFQGFAERGLGETRAEAVFARAVELAVRARDDFWTGACARSGLADAQAVVARSSDPEAPARRLRPLVAAGVGPYGACLADGSEYRGDYGIGEDALEAFQRRRWRTLARTAADVIACETIPSLPEVRVLARLADEFGKPAWISFSCPGRDRLADGSALAEAVAVADAAPCVFAVGVNCCAPDNVADLVAAVAAGTEKAVVAYPNAGGAWDARAKRWSDGEAGANDEGERVDRAAGCVDWATASLDWRAAGADALGGCCRVAPAAIQRMREALEVRCASRSAPATVP